MPSIMCGKLSLIILLVLINSLFMVTGLGLVGCGIWIRVASKDYNTILGSEGLETPANLILAAGSAIFLVSFLGFCGACCENNCLLLLYMVALVLIVLLEIGSVVIAFIFKGKTEEYVTNAVQKTIKDTYGKDGHGAITLAINAVQEEMRCCGANSYLDYNGSMWYERVKSQRERPYPDSCIDASKRNNSVALNDTLNEYIAYDTGCITAMKNAANDQLLFSGAIAASILFIEILGLLGSVSLFRRLKPSASPI